MRFLWCLFLLLFVVGCATPSRFGYDRKTGSYAKPKVQKVSTKKPEKKAKSRLETEAPVAEQIQQEVSKDISAGAYEEAAKSWLGTPYLYGGSSKSGTDCSGFVMQIYKEVRGMSLPHKASLMYDMGDKVSRNQLEEGDLVFFGSVWDIDHVGIYLSGDRFVHASSSKGVIITPMDNVYWKKRYQGARRLE